MLGAPDARSHAVGGWTLTSHHSYDPAGQVLHLGDGTRRSARGGRFLADRLSTLAGTGRQSFDSGADGELARTVDLYSPQQVAVGPDGTVYFTEPPASSGPRVRADGILTTVAGSDTEGFSGDGGPASVARLNSPGDGIRAGR